MPAALLGPRGLLPRLHCTTYITDIRTMPSPSLLQATQKMAEAAAQMPGLKSFVHVSTCYVNGNLPGGTRVPEKVFPLLLEGKPVDYLSTVKELMALPRDPAEEQVSPGDEGA